MEQLRFIKVIEIHKQYEVSFFFFLLSEYNPGI